MGQIDRDKSNFGKTMYMYSRGRYIEGEWVFGGICRETKACFFIVVGQRDIDTLLAIIHSHILPGTMWRALVRLPKIEPQPKLLKPKHRCAHPAQRKYLVRSQTKYVSCRNIRRSLLKLSTEMAVAPVPYGDDPFGYIIKHLCTLLVICSPLHEGKKHSADIRPTLGRYINRVSTATRSTYRPSVDR